MIKKTIIVLEPQDFLLDEIEKFAEEDNAEIIFIMKRNPYYSDNKNIIEMDMFNNYEQSLELLKSKYQNNKFVIITANESYFYVSQKLRHDLSFHDYSESYIVFRDKHLMKERFIEKGIATAKGFRFKDSIELKQSDKQFVYPVIVKPIGGFASCGVKRIDNSEQLIKHAKSISLMNNSFLLKVNNENGIIVEEYIDGDEFSVDTIWFDGVPVIDGVLSKGNDKGPFFPDRIYCCEGKIDDETRKKIIDRTHDAARALGIERGATHIELRVRDGEVFIIEAALRPGAGGYFYEIFKNAMKIDFFKIYYLACTCDSKEEFYSKIPIIEYSTSDRSVFWYNMNLSNYGRIESIANTDSIKQREEVITCKLLQTEGGMIYSSEMGANYFCWIVSEVFGDSPVKKANELAELYDSMIDVRFYGRKS